MIMAARHHFVGSGCVPPQISLTRRWGPVGFMRVGGMGLRSLGLGQPSPVGFADFASYQGAVLASFAPCPPPYDPSCENPRDAAISVALNQWDINPQSCHNVVCNSAGTPQISIAPAGTGAGYNTTGGFVPVTSQTPVRSSSSTPVRNPRPGRPLPPAPAQPEVVNPSPSTQLTTTGSTTTAPGSVVSQANGTVVIPGSTASTVGGTVSTTDTSGDIITGLPNWLLLVGGGILVFLLAKVK